MRDVSTSKFDKFLAVVETTLGASTEGDQRIAQRAISLVVHHLSTAGERAHRVADLNASVREAPVSQGCSRLPNFGYSRVPRLTCHMAMNEHGWHDVVRIEPLDVLFTSLDSNTDLRRLKTDPSTILRPKS